MNTDSRRKKLENQLARKSEAETRETQHNNGTRNREYSPVNREYSQERRKLTSNCFECSSCFTLSATLASYILENR